MVMEIAMAITAEFEVEKTQIYTYTEKAGQASMSQYFLAAYLLTDATHIY